MAQTDEALDDSEAVTYEPHPETRLVRRVRRDTVEMDVSGSRQRLISDEYESIRDEELAEIDASLQPERPASVPPPLPQRVREDSAQRLQDAQQILSLLTPANIMRLLLSLSGKLPIEDRVMLLDEMLKAMPSESTVGPMINNACRLTPGLLADYLTESVRQVHLATIRSGENERAAVECEAKALADAAAFRKVADASMQTRLTGENCLRVIAKFAVQLMEQPA